MYDVVVKSSRSLSHLQMSFLFYKFKDPKMLVRCSQAGILQSGKQHLW